jgi:hypothetical protein
MKEDKLRKMIRLSLIVFIALLVLSGVTAFPLQSELALLLKWSSNAPTFLQEWLVRVYTAIYETNTKYPFMSYGTDWLAFAHLVIATAFIGPLRDPIKNIWVIEFGMIACLMVFPLAFICGSIRGIPIYWQLIDCSFGVFGLVPLYYCRKQIIALEKLITNKQK